MTEEARIVCLDADREPHVQSTLVECGDCHKPLWRSDASFEDDMTPICMQCIPPDKTPKVSTKQITKVAGDMDIPEDDLRAYFETIGIEVTDDG